MDAVDIILRVCLWGSVVLIPILLFWAVFGGRRFGSGKRSRPKPEPVRRQGLTPPPPRQGSPGQEVSRDIPGGHRVMAQTSLGEVLAPQTASGSKEARDLAFRSINSKRLDFLLVDAYGMPVLAVEYQGHGHFSDRTFMHDAVKREALRKAGIRFLEIPAVYDAEDLEKDIRKALLSNPARRA